MNTVNLVAEVLESIEKLLNVPVAGLGWAKEDGSIAILGVRGEYFAEPDVQKIVAQNLATSLHEQHIARTFPATEMGLNGQHTLTLAPCSTAQINHKEQIIGLLLAFPAHVTLTQAQQEGIGALVRLTGTALSGQQTINEAHRRQIQMEAVATVGRDATVLLNPSDLLERVARLVSHQFNFYHTGIFLVDDAGEYAVLRATSSEYGQELIRQQHRLKIGEQGMVGYVTGTGKARIASNVGADDTHYVNPMLPNTRSEITLPMYYGEQVIGALDVQSTKENAFTEDDCTTLQIMADQLANALINARLHEEVWKRLDETHLLREIMVEASALDRREVLRKVLKLLQTELPFTYQAFFERRGAMLHTTPGSVWPQSSYPLDQTPLKEVWAGQPLWHTSAPEMMQWIGSDIQSLSAVPVRDLGRTLVIFAVATAEPERLRPRDQNFLETLEAQMEVLLQNAHHHEMTLRSRELLQNLITTGEAMIAAQEVTPILDILRDTILDKITGTLEIALYTSENTLTWVCQTASPNLERPFFLAPFLNPQSCADGRCRQEKYDLARPEAVAELHFHHPGAADALPHNTADYVLLQPLQTKDRDLGCVLIVLTQADRDDLEERITWIQALANQTALSLDNAQLINRLRAQTKELSRAYEEAKHLNEMREQMIQNVSHELRTPLGIILGYVDMLGEETMGPLNPQQQEIVRTVNSRAQNLNRMIQSLTSLQGRIQLKNIAPVALLDLLQQVVSEFSEFSEQQKVQFYIEADPQIPPIPGDMERLHLAFTHLVENAIKFSPSGGNILIKLWIEEEWVVITFTDQGIGIARQHLARIFERFYQVDGSTTRHFGGMGIGLALVWDIVEAHHGHIQVQSETGKGSTFLVALPTFLSEDSERIIYP
ncbi:MAG: GAF domain-containing protein [Anaerolineae bacterium]|nr:GAF domain-containing protein [Anaerolineae bacterium]